MISTIFVLSFALLFINTSNATKIHVLIYETESVIEPQRKLRSQSKKNNNVQLKNSPAQKLVNQMNDLNQLDILEASIFGQGHEFIGFGSKLIQVLPVLKEMQQQQQPDTLVVISDSRDVLFNSHSDNLDDQITSSYRRSYVQQIVNEFRTSYDALTIVSTSSHKIVVSAEAQCCVSALTHVRPGNAYFDPSLNMARKQYSCSSGAKDCLWNGDEYAQPWENVMKAIQIERTNGIEYDDTYLNAGLMVGTVSDLIYVIEQLQIKEIEDDQALLTDYMYSNPNTILLDYSQTLFGNNRGGLQLQGNEQEDGCLFHKENTIVDGRLKHIQTGTKPLLLHTPGKYYTCLDRMSSDLGYGTSKDTKQIRTRLLQSTLKSRLCNYGVRTPKLGDGIVGNAVITGCEQYTPSAMTPSAPASVVPVPTPVTAPVTVPTIVDAVPVPTPSLDDILGGRTPTSAPVLTPSIFDVVPVPTPSLLSDIIGDRTPSAPVPVPTFFDVPTTEGTVPVSFFDLLSTPTTPTTIVASVSTPTIPTVEGVPVSFLDLLTAPTAPVATAPVPTPITTDGVPVSFLDLLGESHSETEAITTEEVEEQEPASFFDLLNAAPTTPETITVNTPTTAPIVPPTTPTSSFTEFLADYHD